MQPKRWFLVRVPVAGIDVSRVWRDVSPVLTSLHPHVEARLEARGVTLDVVPSDVPLTSLPAYTFLRGRHDEILKRPFDKVPGLTSYRLHEGRIHFAVVQRAFTGADTAYAPRYLATHEAAHVVHHFGLSPGQRTRVRHLWEQHRRSRQPWIGSDYAAAHADEYFAESVCAFFEVSLNTVWAPRTYTRRYLRRNDPAMHELLSEIFPTAPQARRTGGLPSVAAHALANRLWQLTLAEGGVRQARQKVGASIATWRRALRAVDPVDQSIARRAKQISATPQAAQTSAGQLAV